MRERTLSGMQLKQIRMFLGLSQKEVAALATNYVSRIQSPLSTPRTRKMGFFPSEISKIESGHCFQAKRRYLTRILMIIYEARGCEFDSRGDFVRIQPTKNRDQTTTV